MPAFGYARTNPPSLEGLTVYSFNPPPGLAPIVGDGTTDDAPTVQAHLDWVKATYGRGRVVVAAPSGMVKCGRGIVVPAKVQLVMDHGGTFLDFTAVTSGPAITVADDDFTPLVGVSLVGPNSGRSLTDTSIGVSVTGSRLRLYDLQVKEFGRGVDVAHTDTWLVSVVGGSIWNCGTCLYADLVAASASNAGEQILLDNVTLYNSTRAINAAGNGLDLKISNSSIDYCTKFGSIADAWVYFSGCHLESSGNVSDTYLFSVTHNSKVSFANCDVIMGSGTNPLNYLFDPAEAPWNFGNGQAHFANTKIYAQNPSGGDVTWFSQQIFTWPSGQATQSYFTPFPIRWVPVSAKFVGQDFITEFAGTAWASAIPSNGALGQFTLTASSTPGSNVFVRICFS